MSRSPNGSKVWMTPANLPTGRYLWHWFAYSQVMYDSNIPPNQAGVTFSPVFDLPPDFYVFWDQVAGTLTLPPDSEPNLQAIWLVSIMCVTPVQ